MPAAVQGVLFPSSFLALDQSNDMLLHPCGEQGKSVERPAPCDAFPGFLSFYETKYVREVFERYQPRRQRIGMPGEETPERREEQMIAAQPVEQQSGFEPGPEAAVLRRGIHNALIGDERNSGNPFSVGAEEVDESDEEKHEPKTERIGEDASIAAAGKIGGERETGRRSSKWQDEHV